MTDQTKILKFAHSAKSDMIFPVAVEILIVPLFALCDPDKWHKLYPTPTPALIILSFIVTFTSILIAWIQIQRVEIDIEKQTIRFANYSTNHSWKIADLRDAASVRAKYGPKGRPGITIGIKKLSTVASEDVYLDNLDGPSNTDRTDSALFLTLAQQIRAIHPNMKIGVPQSYHGSLPKEICQLSNSL